MSADEIKETVAFPIALAFACLVGLGVAGGSSKVLPELVADLGLYVNDCSQEWQAVWRRYTSRPGQWTVTFNQVLQWVMKPPSPPATALRPEWKLSPYMGSSTWISKLANG